MPSLRLRKDCMSKLVESRKLKVYKVRGACAERVHSLCLGCVQTMAVIRRSLNGLAGGGISRSFSHLLNTFCTPLIHFTEKLNYSVNMAFPTLSPGPITTKTIKYIRK